VLAARRKWAFHGNALAKMEVHAEHLIGRRAGPCGVVQGT
jgi:hypothetical protein